MRQSGNDKGFVIVYVALMLFAILAITGVAIDLAYMYLVKNDLQTASDASALAGAGELRDINNLPTPDRARQSAWKFACKNRAVGKPVYLQTTPQMFPKNAMATATDSCSEIPNLTDLNYSNSERGDIVLGHWDGTAFTPQLTDVNAVKTVARRTCDSPNGPVSVFLGKIMGWNTMSAKAEAIAARAPYATPSLVFCIRSCSELTMPALMVLQGDSNQDIPNGMGWTEYGDKQAPNLGPNGGVQAYIRGERLAPQDLCGKCITTNGGVGSAIKELRERFEDTSYRREDKTITCDPNGHCQVQNWTVSVPIVDNDTTCNNNGHACSPGGQGSTYEPYHEVYVAVVRITQVITQGTDKGVVIDQIDCGNCTDWLYSHQNKLVK